MNMSLAEASADLWYADKRGDEFLIEMKPAGAWRNDARERIRRAVTSEAELIGIDDLGSLCLYIAYVEVAAKFMIEQTDREGAKALLKSVAINIDRFSAQAFKKEDVFDEKFTEQESATIALAMLACNAIVQSVKNNFPGII